MNSLSQLRDSFHDSSARASQIEAEIKRLRKLKCVCELSYCSPCREEIALKKELANLRQLSEVA